MAKRISNDNPQDSLPPILAHDDEHNRGREHDSETATSSTRSLSLNGLRVLSLESRQATAMRNLLRDHGASATVVPAMREIPHENHPSLGEFVEELQAERVEISVWTSGVGVRLLAEQLDRKIARASWTTLLSQRPIVARGTKTVAALRALQLAPTLVVPPPHTWRQTLQLLDARRAEMPLSGRCVVLQEPGTPNRVLERALVSRGARLLRLAVYAWAMPHDTTALLRAINDILEGAFDVVMFSNGTQVWHLFKLAYRNNTEDELRRALKRSVLVSIGPSTTAALAEFELVPHLESPSSQMRDFVAFVAAYAPSLAP